MTVGSWVVLKRSTSTRTRAKARILVEDDAYAPGAVKLSRALDGFYWWNKADLVETIPPARKDKPCDT